MKKTNIDELRMLLRLYALNCAVFRDILRINWDNLPCHVYDGRQVKSFPEWLDYDDIEFLLDDYDDIRDKVTFTNIADYVNYKQQLFDILIKEQKVLIAQIINNR